ncbi:MAG TPA: hypothetical protein VFK79_10230 [Xanthobacteraceae bacterium]|nr:hypothetical protein [Xanthobacteraceae bacterium]
MNLNRAVLAMLAGIGLVSSAALFVYAAPKPAPARITGSASTLGNGTVASYAQFEPGGAPKAIGVVFTGAAFANLPTAPSDGHRCLDGNGDGEVDHATECAHWHERVLPLPSDASRRADMPFKWVLLNWNPHGHLPPGIYDSPHFDIHFYMEPIEKVFAIQRGACGPEFVRCDQFERAKLPVPKNYMHPDFKDVDAVAPAMGNHLIDLTSPEFHGHAFDHTFIYGAYEGRVTFYETMLTLEFLQSRPATCAPIKAVPAVATTGYYPTKRCYRYVKDKDEYTVSFEDFKLRQASAPSDAPQVNAAASTEPADRQMTAAKSARHHH